MLPGANVEHDSHSEDDESETLSDIDDEEVDMYLNNEEEKHLKKILWERANRDYLQEQVAKEQPANKKASTSETVAKSRKEMKQRRAREAQNIVQAQSSAEASDKTRSLKCSRVNHDRLSQFLNQMNEVEMEQADEFGYEGGDIVEIRVSNEKH